MRGNEWKEFVKALRNPGATIPMRGNESPRPSTVRSTSIAATIPMRGNEAGGPLPRRRPLTDGYDPHEG